MQKKYTASSKTWELNSDHSVLCLPRAKNDRRLTSESSSSRVRHRVTAAKPRGCGPEKTQRVTDAYTENCVVCIKITVLAIVAFAIVGSNTTGY